MINYIPCYITEDNFYNDNTIIAIDPHKTSYDEYAYNKIYLNQDLPLCLIDSQQKNNFIKALLEDNCTYLIQGQNISMQEAYFVDNDNNLMTYFDWDENQPIISMEDYAICININKKWESSNIYDKHYPILEYHLKFLSDYFNNPRIYYQVFDTQEVT